jgi:hypothetical protein
LRCRDSHPKNHASVPVPTSCSTTVAANSSSSCRRMVQGQLQLQQPLSSHRRQSTSYHSDVPSFCTTSPRPGSFMAPPTPYDGLHTARCPEGSGLTTDGPHEARMQRCESAPPPQHLSLPEGGPGLSNTALQDFAANRSHIHSQEHDQHHAQVNLLPEAVTRAKLTIHVPRGRLATRCPVAEDPCTRSTSLPASRDGPHPGNSSPLRHAVSAFKTGEFCAAVSHTVDPGMSNEVCCTFIIMSGCSRYLYAP